MKPLSLVFAGTPDFGLPCLSALYDEGYLIKAVYTQPDRPAGRGKHLQASPIKLWALERDIPVIQPLNFKDPETVTVLRDLNPDVMVVIAYGLILPATILNIPRYGCLNVHASLLPRWRGASPIQQAILAGDVMTGVTIMQMDVGMDTGDMLNTALCPITIDDNTATMHHKLSEIAVQPLLNTLTAVAEGQQHPVKQAPELVTYAPKINKEDALIDWSCSADVIINKIRAYYPWPVAYTHLNGEVLRIHRAVVVHEATGAKPGTVLSAGVSGMIISTGEHCLKLDIIQSPGGRPMPVKDWLNAKQHRAVNSWIIS